MRIEKNTTEVQRPEAARHATLVPAAAPGQPVAATERPDRVELSPEARALAARLDETGGADALTPERIAELRRRIRDGVYDSPEMAAKVAGRLLDSGDL